MPSKPVAKKPIPGKPKAVKTQKNIVQKKPAPEKPKGLRLLKETLPASLVQKKPAPDKVENLAKEYLAELREVDVTFEKGTAVLEKYRAKYPELASYIREIVPGERRIEIRQRLGVFPNLRIWKLRAIILSKNTSDPAPIKQRIIACVHSTARVGKSMVAGGILS